MKCYDSEEDAANSYWREAEAACESTFKIPPPAGWCPGTFDGWNCWNHTPPNTTAIASCPGFVDQGMHSMSATKLCRPDGTWWRTSAGREWANYTACFEDTSFYDYHRSLNLILYIGYSFSIVLCLLALLVHYLCKSLNCGRTKVHQHLFASYVFSCFSQLLWLRVQENVHVLMLNPSWCKLVHVLAIYFLLSNYAWMFCEGLYLYCILKFTFIKERNLLIANCLIGWVFPLVPTVVYVTLRVGCIQHGQQLQNCWTFLITDFWWSYASFSLACQICNFMFLVAILRLVYTKSTDPSSNNQSGISINKLLVVLRALWILVPLLGVQYLLSCFRPTNPERSVTTVYEICYSLFTSLQGSAVATLFCFSNSEVKNAVYRKWLSWRLSRSGHSVISNSLATASATTQRAGSVSVGSHFGSEKPVNNGQHDCQALLQMTDLTSNVQPGLAANGTHRLTDQ